ncbi:GNAT family N-acetyltransferase [Oceanibacterium hippocampi]|uniref:Acetyltransferase (GNAT) family protein n=1 Tax=Oceanibacterium hippocampi TaxID=745714 RepID=A0A1Y5TYU5_9PROT|nr:GNAT family N-acetyltransferase [Oceanibacterium hippocampi]SLN76142.1 Acetyltransferase (GNAT) family protein [Oceanibacterium hippocampi]
MAITTRPLQAEDHAAWLPLWSGYLSFYETELAPGISERTWARLLDPVVPLDGLAALDTDGRMIGFVHFVFHLSTWAPAERCYLEDLFVAPGIRGSGAGRALIEAVFAASARRGCDQVYWHTAEDNVTARRLYDRIGRLSPFVRYTD